ncbi:MAG: response regulator [Ignavibacteriales bacterium]|nr:response regulator [Ignavibacteriales bacterium]
MNPKVANTAKPAAPAVSQKDKDAARQCLMLADKFLKESDFEKARQEVAKAQKLDPTNPYAYAFLDRIAYFEEQKKKSSPPSPAATPQQPKGEAQPAGKVQSTPQIQPQPTKATAPPQPKTEVSKPTVGAPATKTAVPPASQQPQAEKRAEQKPLGTPPAVQTPPVSKPPVAKTEPRAVVEATRSVISDVMSSRTSHGSPPGIAEVLQQVSQGAQQHEPNAPRTDVDAKLEEMRRQIEMLTGALEQERKVREEMNQQKLKGAINQLRSALETAWMNGAPKAEETDRLNRLGIDLGIPEDVIHTITREVKLDMYSRAVKEVVSKQKLIRNSSRTLEWLRNVYQVSLDEYLEYESKFLMDLVADQYKGTILLVAAEERTSKETGQKLKSMGYAVVTSTSPENALEKIEKINPHFILCDMEFPAGHLSGIKFLHVLRANSKFNYTPFILLCAAGDITQLESSELKPTEGYIQKPFDIDKLGVVMNEKLIAFRQYLSSL